MADIKIMKRSGEEVLFEKNKIVRAIEKANAEMLTEDGKLSSTQIEAIASKIKDEAVNSTHILGVEDIQDMVEMEIMKAGAFEVARKYVRYRYKKELARKANTTDARILSLISLNNEDIKQENSNKNPTLNSVQRDYVAGEVSKDLSKRFLLDQKIWNAHEEGIIHFHDADYFGISREYNCCLVNLEDMLQNGTVISETMIETPHRFTTACNITTQIVAQVSSSQYGLI